MNMYKFIEYLYYSSHEKLILIYNVDKEDQIKIFGEEFIGSNGNKCSIIYQNKIIPFESYILVKNIDKDDKNKNIFEIVLLELEDISNKSYMFFQCTSLVELDKFELNEDEIKGNKIEEEKYFNSRDTNINFYLNNINEEIIKENDYNSSYGTFKLFLSEYDKVYKVKKNNINYLKNMKSLFRGCFH